MMQAAVLSNYGVTHTGIRPFTVNDTDVYIDPATAKAQIAAGGPILHNYYRFEGTEIKPHSVVLRGYTENTYLVMDSNYTAPNAASSYC